MSSWSGVVKTIKQSRPNLGRILERKAKAVDFDPDLKRMVIYIPAGGLRDPEEILDDFIAELTKFDTSSWRIEAPRFDIGVNLKTLHEEASEKKNNKIKQAKENPIIKKILSDLIEADVVDVL